jgi:two-component system response regulator TctD
MKAARVPAADGQSPERAYRALVVEDDPAIGRLVARLLTRKHIETEVVMDGGLASTLLDSNDYDVVILDLMVPGVNGFELIEHLRKQPSPPPVAVVSAVSHESLTQLDLDIVKLVIAKPFDVDEFSKAIVTLCKDGDQ